MTEDHPLPRPAPDVMCQRFDDGAVLFSTRTEVYYGLNLVGTTVWELLAEAPSFDALCESVGRRHPGAEAGTVRQDVRSLVDDLLAEGVLVRGAGEDAPSLSTTA